MTTNKPRRPDPAPRPSFGMARASARHRRRATIAVRSLTALGGAGAILGCGYLTAALVPAAAANAGGTSTVGAEQAAPSSAPAAVTSAHAGKPKHRVTSIPKSLSGTKAHPKAHPHAHPATTSPPPVATTPPAPAVTRAARPPRPVATSGGS
jgi:hypothetical protein